MLRLGSILLAWTAPPAATLASCAVQDRFAATVVAACRAVVVVVHSVVLRRVALAPMSAALARQARAQAPTPELVAQPATNAALALAAAQRGFVRAAT
jgi:heme exporter protein D